MEKINEIGISKEKITAQINAKMKSVGVVILKEHDQEIIDKIKRASDLVIKNEFYTIVQLSKSSTKIFAKQNGQDIDDLLLKMSLERVKLATKLQDLFFDSYYSKDVLKDELARVYKSLPIKMTVRQKDIEAESQVKSYRLFNYLKYITYEKARELFRALENQIYILAKVRNNMCFDKNYNNETGE